MSNPAFTRRVIELVEITGHIGLARDMALAETIPEATRCKRCRGTGNQLYSMYQACVACEATGVSRGNEDQFK